MVTKLIGNKKIDEILEGHEPIIVEVEAEPEPVYEKNEIETRYAEDGTTLKIIGAFIISDAELRAAKAKQFFNDVSL